MLTRQINFIEHNDDLELVFQRQVHVGQGLRLHSLRAQLCLQLLFVPW